MNKKSKDTIQNRFTAYLVVAVTNQRIHYMERKKFLKEVEAVQSDMLDKKYLDFDEQYHGYIGEQIAFIMEDWEKFDELMVMLEREKLFKVVNRLKEHEKKLLFARIFGELTFAEIGKKFGMKPKQAEMAYFYIIRKLRKGLEDKKDEF